jgi:hypothetical protein
MMLGAGPCTLGTRLEAPGVDILAGEEGSSEVVVPDKDSIPLPNRCNSLTAALVLAPDPKGPSKLGTIDVSG